MLEVIATERLKSRSSSGAVTAWIDSELVRTTSPSRSESRGSAPLVLAVGEQLVGAERAGGDHDALRAVSVWRPRAEPGAGALGA